MSSLLKVLVVLFVTVLVAGCKVAVMVVEGGEVQSTGSGTCEEGTICIIEVKDTNFSETFTADPNWGMQFVRWNKGEGLLCGGSTDPTCVVSTVGAAGNTVIEAVIASDQTFYIMPIFGPGPETDTDTVTVDGREWAQLDQFTDLSWSDINAVCPAGVCSGVLNGYNMTGWTWASVDDVYALFIHYSGGDIVGAPDHRLGTTTTVDCSVARAFFRDGWRRIHYTHPVSGDFPQVGGWVRRTGDTREHWFQLVDSLWYGGMDRCYLDVEWLGQTVRRWDATPRGAWFWRAL